MDILKFLGIAIFFLVIIFLPFQFFKKNVCHEPIIKLGIDVLEEQKFDVLQGKKIGVLTNQAGVNRKGELTWKVLKNAPGVDLRVIFAPVHGLNGKYMANETFYNDEIEGIPIYSVYASNSKPKDEWIKGLDAVVIDLQGVGMRCYNYWAFMVYMMAACFEKNIEIIILDRPNPLGGEYIGGPILEASNTSIWGPIEGLPLFYGLTIGELAKFTKSFDKDIVVHQQVETGVIHTGLHLTRETLNKGKLTVIPMQGWKRDMLWQNTGLQWIQTSPNIPNLQSTYEFLFLGIGRWISVNYGHDNCYFLKIEPDWEKNLFFHKFSSKFIAPYRFIQYFRENCQGYQNGYTLDISRKDKNVVEINVKDIRKTPPGMFGLLLLTLSQKYARFYFDSDENRSFIGSQIGDNELVDKVFKMEPIDPKYFENKWHVSALKFLEKAKPFFLYD